MCSLLAAKANCVSYSALQDYSLVVRKLKKNNIIAIPNGVDFERIESVIKDTKCDFELNRNKMVCIGRMIPLKNHEFLINLLTKLPNYKLILIGMEDKEGKIRGLVKNLNLSDRVEFTGLMPRNDVFKKMCECSIYVSSSYVEGLPVSVLEAMSVGLIPLLSNIGPHIEIENQCKDIKVLDLEYQKWENTLYDLEKLSNEELENLSNKIKKEVREKYSLETMHDHYYKLYEELSK